MQGRDRLIAPYRLSTVSLIGRGGRQGMPRKPYDTSLALRLMDIAMRLAWMQMAAGRCPL